MNERVRQVVTISDFPGWMSNVDPEDIPAGAGVIQTNTVIEAGELVTRYGLQRLNFDEGEEG